MFWDLYGGCPLVVSECLYNVHCLNQQWTEVKLQYSFSFSSSLASPPSWMGRPGMCTPRPAPRKNGCPRPFGRRVSYWALPGYARRRAPKEGGLASLLRNALGRPSLKNFQDCPAPPWKYWEMFQGRFGANAPTLPNHLASCSSVKSKYLFDARRIQHFLNQSLHPLLGLHHRQPSPSGILKKEKVKVWKIELNLSN